MDEQVIKELQRISRLPIWTTKEMEYAAAHLHILLAEIVRLGQYEKAWEDYQIWLKRDSGEVRHR